jgi:hypothetical protein
LASINLVLKLVMVGLPVYDALKSEKVFSVYDFGRVLMKVYGRRVFMDEIVGVMSEMVAEGTLIRERNQYGSIGFRRKVLDYS